MSVNRYNIDNSAIIDATGNEWPVETPHELPLPEGIAANIFPKSYVSCLNFSNGVDWYNNQHENSTHWLAGRLGKCLVKPSPTPANAPQNQPPNRAMKPPAEQSPKQEATKELQPFRPDRAAFESRIRSALKPVPKRAPQLQNHY